MDEQATSVNAVENTAPENAAQETTTEAVETQGVTATDSQAENTTEQPNESRIEKAFAARLRKEQEKLEKQYSNHKFIIEKAAAENDMTVEEYLNAVKQQYEDKEFENLDPTIKEDIKWARERRAREAEETKTKAETENGTARSSLYWKDSRT